MNRNDRKIAIAALCVAVMVSVLLFFSEGRTSSTKGKELESNRQNTAVRKAKYYGSYGSEQRKETFPFDPNTADSTQLLRLGLQPWQVRNIYKYRSRGGIYRKKEDFAKLYGLTVKDYRRLEPYIRISSDYLPASTLVREERQERDTLRYPVKLEENEHVILNTADTATLRKVPGIGSYYAKEIVRYGQRLGGYVSVDQLDEIADFPQDAKKYFVIEDAHPQQLNVNPLTLQQLRRHPYIHFYRAKAIMDYRRLHGNLKSLQDLRLSKDFPPEVIERLNPYVTF